MKKTLTTLGSKKRKSGSPDQWYVGAELDALFIRAAVFDGLGRLIGKSKRSAKLERGATAVLRRIAQCIKDAADECDLKVKSLSGVGLGIVAHVMKSWSQGKTASRHPSSVPQYIQKKLRKILAVPVFVESDSQLSSLGVCELELDKTPKVMAVIYCSTQLGSGLLIDGKIPAEEILKPLHVFMDKVQRQLIREMPEPSICQQPKSKIRKFARRRNAAVLEFARLSARFAGITALKMIELYQPNLIAFSGGLIEELKDEMMPIIMKTVQKQIGHKIRLPAQFLASELGDSAVLVGGAFQAQRHHIT